MCAKDERTLQLNEALNTLYAPRSIGGMSLQSVPQIKTSDIMHLSNFVSWLWGVTVLVASGMGLCQPPVSSKPSQFFQQDHSQLNPHVSESLQRLFLGVVKKLCCCRRASRARLQILREWNSVKLDTKPLTAFDQKASSYIETTESTITNDALQLPALVTGLHAITFPCVISAVTDCQFPFDLLGSVHESSQIEIINKSLLQRVLGEERTAVVSVTFDSERDITPHRRGSICTFVTTIEEHKPNVNAAVGEMSRQNVLWQSRTNILFFHRNTEVAQHLDKTVNNDTLGVASASRSLGQGDGGVRGCDSADANSFIVAGKLRLPEQFGRLWATVARDYNPIHMHRYLARLFGFRSIVAHGMAALHLALTSTARYYNHDTSKAVNQVGNHANALTANSLQVQISFLRPLFCPSSVTVRTGGADALTVQLIDDKTGKECVSCTIVPIQVAK